jgi:Fe2+ transport system protein FeoA
MGKSKNLENVISLLDLPIGEEATISHLVHKNGFFAIRMMELGIKEGARIIRRTPEFPCSGGPVAVQVGQSSYCLGCGEASKIYVRYEK